MFKSIEERAGVNQEGYQPPVDQAVVEAPCKAFDWIDVLWCLIFPPFGVVAAIKRLIREEVGPGLAYLVLAVVGFAAYGLLVP